jgi:2-polyprenyl-6-methoxyphenol hydroxylase-like FAD-dependent oxidoreductase
MRILIAGGGVGGLTLALMLHQRGIACRLFEAAPEVKPLGVGINALPHSVRELAGLGLLPELDAIAIRTRRLTYANQLGQAIWSEPRGLYGGHDAPQFCIHRGHLQAMLWRVATERLGTEVLCPGHRLIGFKQGEDTVTARFQTPEGNILIEEGDALVGADGIHSALRALLHPAAGGICWNGISMWRGAVDWPAFDGGDAMVIAGDAVAKLVLYPIGPGRTPGTRLTNWVIYARVAEPGAPLPARESWSRPGRIEDFAQFAGRLRLPFIDTGALIRATAEVFEYPMCDRDPLPHWTQGRVTLLGDAAHAMYPVGSNGASQAILDARCLADLLVGCPMKQSVPEALLAYQDVRLPVTAAVVRSNRTGGPERVIDLVAQRAPEGFAHIDEVAMREEIEEVALGYARLAGFAMAAP